MFSIAQSKPLWFSNNSGIRLTQSAVVLPCTHVVEKQKNTLTYDCHICNIKQIPLYFQCTECFQTWTDEQKDCMSCHKTTLCRGRTKQGERCCRCICKNNLGFCANHFDYNSFDFATEISHASNMPLCLAQIVEEYARSL